MLPQIVILDFGSQYTQLIARRIREQHIYCEVFPYHSPPVSWEGVKGVILSGGPESVQSQDAPTLDFSLFQNLPILGICYGAQLMVHQKGGNINPSHTSEYGKARLVLRSMHHPLFKGMQRSSQVWMSHTDTITALPTDCEILAETETVGVVAFAHKRYKHYGIQFHPEVTHTEEGKILLRNFLIDLCGCCQDWTSSEFVEDTCKALVEKLGDDSVIMALSGGVDSTVAALLIHKAIGNRLQCIVVDNGLMRKDEFAQVLTSYQHMGLRVKGVDASHEFYKVLHGKSDPEVKRKAIGETFINVFEREARSMNPSPIWLGQGTIYPDVIESTTVWGASETIKTHHNVGGLPEKMHMRIVEPLRMLFKDEVRNVGKAMHIDKNILERHPFPGPGLGIRIIGEVTQEKVLMLQKADAIFIESLRKHNLYETVWQAGVILLNVRSVGVMGDERSYRHAVALRAVTSVDGMTANWVHLPHEVMGNIASTIINEVKGINRVVYDISSKPPATIEWE